MRFAVVGAGAIGGLIGARLARAGEDVVLVARGAQLDAIRERGVTVRGDGEFHVDPPATDDVTAVRDADVVFLTMKASGLAASAPRLAEVLAPSAVVVTAQNGIPFWYFERHGGPLEGTRLLTIDPDGTIARAIPVERIVGCAVYPAAELVAPGVIWHVEGLRLPIGEPDGSRSERCQAISAALSRAGFKAPVRARIRDDIWLKLLGNAALNPVSALARATLDEIGAQPESRALAIALAEETAQVALRLGVRLEIGIEQRLAAALRITGHRTSMLADIEAGRPTEIDALVGAVIEIGSIFGLELARLRAVHACVKLLERRPSVRERPAEPVPALTA